VQVYDADGVKYSADTITPSLDPPYTADPRAISGAQQLINGDVDDEECPGVIYCVATTDASPNAYMKVREFMVR